MSMWQAQHDSVALWLLDSMPFVFAVWGQYVGVLLAHEAGALVQDQTQALRVDNHYLKKWAGEHASQDILTGLADRRSFLEATDEAIEHCHGTQARVGVLVLDVDRFHEINEVLGQHNGDRVLQKLARRLRRALAPGVRFARLSADCFAIMLPQAADENALAETARQLDKALEPPFTLESVALNVHVSCGGALCPEHAADAEALLNRADDAMRYAKRHGGIFYMYRAHQHAASVASLSLTADLRSAIASDQLRLFVQPMVGVASDDVFGAEALLRWQHPERGLVGPAEFIPHAERTSVILELSYWVLEHAMRTLAQLRQQGQSLQMSINLSARCMLDPGFPDELAGLLAAHAVDPTRLTLEITENTLMVDHTRVREALARIAQMGVTFSIDDFGTGYSQLAYLKRLPVSELKIDQSFVRDMLTSDTDLAIVRATVELGHALGLRVVGEGVESQEQVERLTELECDILQGYYIGRPMPAHQLPDWIAAWHGGRQEESPNRLRRIK